MAEVFEHAGHLARGVAVADLILDEALGPARFGEVGDAYSAMAGIGVVTDVQRQIFFTAGRELMARGAEAIMLGGTDLFLAFVGQPQPFPLVDCADIHVDAIFKRSAGQPPA